MNPFQNPTHSLAPSSIHTQSRTQPTKVEPSFRKVNVLPAKLGVLTPSLESLATHLLPLTSPGLRPTIQNSS